MMGEERAPGGGSRVHIPEHKGEMAWETQSLLVWDLESEGVRLWRRDSRRQAPGLEPPYGREFGLHPVVHGEPLKHLNRRLRSYIVGSE